MEGIMNEQANIDLVKGCYDAYSKHDIARLLGYIAQDVDWELPYVEAIPFSGKRHGLDQVSGFFSKLDELQEAREMLPRDFIAADDRVIVTGHYEWTVKATGAEYGSDFIHIFTIAKGKIAKFKEYTDTHAAALAYQPQGALGTGTRATAGRPAMH
jgi:ketosteroid isomerase-like protein